MKAGEFWDLYPWGEPPPIVEVDAETLRNLRVERNEQRNRIRTLENTLRVITDVANLSS